MPSEWKCDSKREQRKWKHEVEIGDVEIKVNWQLLDAEINIVNPVSAPSAKVSRSNGPRPAPGIAVQKEEWDSLNYAHTQAHICVHIYVCNSSTSYTWGPKCFSLKWKI